MTLAAVTFRPGIFDDDTAYMDEGTYSNSNLIRFRSGLPQMIGGWRRANPGTFSGAARAMHAWSEIDGTIDIAAASAVRLEIIRAGGSIADITPLSSSGILTAAPFAASAGQAVITVSHTAHGRLVGDVALFSGATTVAGLDLNGYFLVATVPDADHYTVVASAAANATTSGGGAAVAYSYLIHMGPSNTTPGYGWGAGGWGGSSWGTPRTSSTITAAMATWTMDNWGQDLIACPRGQKPAIWSAANPSNRAAVITNAPTANAIIVSPDDRHLIALGADGDPMKIKWCAQEDYNTWTATPFNDADERRLLHGSKIIAGQRTTGEILIWTDEALYSLQYTGGPYTFSLRRIGNSGGLIGLHAKAELNGVTYWMGQGQFYAYSGRPQVLKCSVLKTVFDALDDTQGDKVVCGFISAFNEAVWFYPSKTGGEIDSYAKYNYAEDTWDIGALARSIWIDPGIFSGPLGISPDGILYEHEIGTTADGAPIASWIETGDSDIGDGEDITFVERMIPDFKVSGGINLYFKWRNYPGDRQRVKGPYRIDSATRMVDFRARARVLSMRIEAPANVTEDIVNERGDQLCDGAGNAILSAVARDPSSIPTFWRLGRMRFDIKANGKR